MNSYAKVLISSLAALLATQTEAKGMHNSCLQLSDATIGHSMSNNVFVSNEEGLISDEVNENMRLYGFKQCSDQDNNLIGLQYFLSDKPYNDD